MMLRKIKWMAAGVVAGTLLLTAVTTGALAQAAPGPTGGFCPGMEAMVQDGRLTQAQADAMIERMRGYMETQPRTGMMGGPGMMRGAWLTR